MDIEAEVARLLNDPKSAHKRVVDYVLRQIQGGRRLSEILEDPYVTNRAAPLERRALLEEPAVVEAVGDEVAASLRAKLDGLIRS